MKKDLECITKDALVLTPNDRRELMNNLMTSFGMEHPTPLSPEEIESRRDDIESGDAVGIPNEKVFEHILKTHL